MVIVVENLPAPLDRRVWQESQALRDAGYQVTVICPKMRGFNASAENIDGIQIYRHWITDEEKERILAYQAQHPEVGYRVLTYMMMDEDIAVVSPTSTYRVLSKADRLNRWDRKPSTKGQGFDQPTKPHEQCLTSISSVRFITSLLF